MFSPRLLCSFSKVRWFSTSAVHAPPGSVYSRVRNFILTNKNLLGDVEPSKTVSTIQQELLKEIDAVDINTHEFKMHQGGETSKEAPNLVPFDEERRIVGCICHEDTHHVTYVMLYKGIPTRCRCGTWYKLVGLDEYEAARDRYWKKVQGQPENAQLTKDLEESEAALAGLIEDSKGMNHKSEGAQVMLDKLATQWRKYKNAYHLIRKKIDEAPFTEIR